MERIECREFLFRRNIGAPGLTKTVVIVDNKIVKPTHRQMSKTGAHGVDVYCMKQEDWGKAIVITFNVSNSGKAHIDCEGIEEDLCTMVHELFLYHGSVEKP
jgi:hypothetical protein